MFSFKPSLKYELIGKGEIYHDELQDELAATNDVQYSSIPISNIPLGYMPSVPRLYRIRALRDIPTHNIKAGDLGGWVDSRDVLDQRGDCWIGGEAKVFTALRESNGGIYVRGDALITEHAIVAVRAPKEEVDSYHGIRPIVIDQNAIIRNYASVSKDRSDYHITYITGRAYISGGASLYSPEKITGSVENNALIQSRAKILGNAKVGGNAVIWDSSVVSGQASVSEDAQLSQYCKITGSAVIRGKAKLERGVEVNGNAIVSGHAILLKGCSVSGQANVLDTARIGEGASISGDVSVTGNSVVLAGEKYRGIVTLQDYIPSFFKEGMLRRGYKYPVSLERLKEIESYRSRSETLSRGSNSINFGLEKSNKMLNEDGLNSTHNKHENIIANAEKMIANTEKKIERNSMNLNKIYVSSQEAEDFRAAKKAFTARGKDKDSETRSPRVKLAEIRKEVKNSADNQKITNNLIENISSMRIPNNGISQSNIVVENVELTLAQNKLITLLETIHSYESDIVKILSYPTFTDVTDDKTLEMTLALKRVQGLGPLQAPEKFVEAVNDLERKVLIAEAHARRVASSRYSEAERKKVDMAQQLFALVVDEAAADTEKRNAFKQGFKSLEGIVAVPDVAVSEMWKRSGMKELESGAL